MPTPKTSCSPLRRGRPERTRSDTHDYVGTHRRREACRMTPDESREFRARVGEPPEPPPIDPFPLTDLGNAERLVAIHGADVRYANRDRLARVGRPAIRARRHRRDVPSREAHRTSDLPRRSELRRRRRTQAHCPMGPSVRVRAAATSNDQSRRQRARCRCPPQRPRRQPVRAQRPERHDRPPHRQAQAAQSRRSDHEASARRI